MLQKAFPRLPGVGGNLRQPDGCLDRLHLTEKGFDIAEGMMPPVMQQVSRFRCDLPVVWVLQVSPLIYMTTKIVDNRCGVVLLVLGGKSFAFIKDEIGLNLGLFALAGFGNGRYVFRPPACLNNSLRRLPLIIHFPMTRGVFIWRVEDRPFEEPVVHG